MLMPVIKVVPDPAAVAQAAAERIVTSAEAAIEARGLFSILLSGGSTPKALYTLLAAEPFRSAIDWMKVLIFFGDERCVPPTDAQSNYRMARESLLSRVPVPGDNIYRIRGEIDPHEAAKRYGETLKEYFADAGPDVTLLGMGEEGHTASLFPDTEALSERKHRCVANFVPKLDAWRVTTTAPFLNRSAEVLILVTGAAKSGTVAEVLEGPQVPDKLPIQLIKPSAGQLIWFMDAAAAGMHDAD